MQQNLSNRPNRPYQIVEYNSEWPRLYEKYAEIIKAILGQEIDSIDHVGSTSIPGMAGKPQIDIVVVVKNLAKIRNYYDAMRQNGFEPRGNYTGLGEEYFTLDDVKTDQRLTGAHVLQRNNPEVKKQLLFRDYMRTHPQEVELYSQTKRYLKSKHPHSYLDYYQGKDAVIEQIKHRALEWGRDHN